MFFRSVESGLALGNTSDATCTPTAIQLMVLPTQRLRTRLPVRMSIEERRWFREMLTFLANPCITMETQWKPTFQEGWSGLEPSSTTTRRSAGTTRTRLTDHQSGYRTTCQVLYNLVTRNWNSSLVWMHLIKFKPKPSNAKVLTYAVNPRAAVVTPDFSFIT